MSSYRRNPFDAPPRTSSASSYSSADGSSYSSRPSGNRPNYDRYNNGRSDGGARRFDNRDRFGGSSSSYNNNNSGDRNSNDFDRVDSGLMNANAGTIGLDPTNMAPIKKEFYKEHPEVASMTEAEVQEFRRNAQMVISGKDVPKPVKTFEHAGYPSEVLRRLKDGGFENPTPIQSQGWSMALSGQNMVGIAQTGSGKTLSFVLPAIMHILGQEPLKRGDGPIALVLAPTRELANQIQEVARVYCNVMRLHSTCLYGGASRGPQIRAMQSGCELVIATPGRLLDLVNEHFFDLKRISFLVLDEADRMLDMGFEPQIRKILQMIRLDRQVLMWSATWPKEVMRLAHDMLGRDFIQVKIGSAELQANRKIDQEVIICEEHDKMGHLSRILEELWNAVPEPTDSKQHRQMPRTIVFANKKRVVDNIVRTLYADQWPVVAIHGDKSQGERDHAIRMLKSGRIAILVATDVAARGLDVKEVECVVNFDMPDDIENYVHRIGRTARGDADSGKSYAFVTSENANVVGGLVKIMEDAGQKASPELCAMIKHRGGGNRRNFGGSYRGNNNNNRRWNNNGGGGYQQRHGHGGGGGSGYHQRSGGYAPY